MKISKELYLKLKTIIKGISIGSTSREIFKSGFIQESIKKALYLASQIYFKFLQYIRSVPVFVSKNQMFYLIRTKGLHYFKAWIKSEVGSSILLERVGNNVYKET